MRWKSLIPMLLTVLVLCSCSQPEARDEELTGLQSEVATLTEELDEKQKAVQSLEEEIAELKNQINALNDELSLKGNELSDLEAQNSTLSEQLTTQNRLYKDLEKELAKKSERITELEARIAELEATITELEEVSRITWDWIVTGDTTIEDVSVVLEGDLVIRPGASLTLQNVNLTMNCSYDGEYGILAEPGGSIFIYDSKITSPNPLQRWAISPENPRIFGPTGVTEQESPRFSFLANRAEAFVMKGSELQGCGWGGAYGDHALKSTGLWLDNVDSVTIEENTFSNNNHGLAIHNMSSLSIRSNIFSNSDASAIYLGTVSDIVISDNEFYSNAFGIFGSHLGVNHTTITNNTFTDFREAAVTLAIGCENNIIADNDISARTLSNWSGIMIGAMAQPANNNSVIDNNISGCQHGVLVYYSLNNRIENNSINGSNCGITLGYASQNIIVDNTITQVGWEEALTSENGIHLYHSHDNIIANNDISLTKTYGIILCNSSQGNTLQGNNIQSCPCGIGVYQSSNNNGIINNAVSFSDESPIILNNSNENIISSNNFTDNGEPAYDNSSNQWQWQGTGNYWSNYDGQDDNNDGVGDSHQLINPSGIDSYPMLEPLIITQLLVPEREDVPMPWGLGLGEPITGEVTWQDRTITLGSAQLIVGEGGSLTLDNVTLLMPRGVNGIYVHSGGSLQIYNSKIVPTGDGGGFLFQILEGGVLIMEDSELRGCGIAPHSDDWGGLYIGTTTATIKNCLIADAHFGIVVHLFWLRDTSIYIMNNTISDCYQAITWALIDERDITGHIENNTVINCIK